MKNVSTHLGKLSVLATLLMLGSNAFAAGFSLQEQNAVQTGDFGAGGAAIAEDASTAFYNPAGLVLLQEPQLVLAANYVDFATRYTGDVTYTNAEAAHYGAPTSSTQAVNNVGGGTGNVIPAFHASYPINNRLVAGFSVVSPLGLSTDYEADNYVKYNAVETTVKTIDLAPSLGFAVNKKFSVGLGLDVERLAATLSNYVGISPVSPALASYDSYSENKAYAWGYGYHAGMLYQFTPQTRVGLAYHSQVAFDATGTSTLTGPLAAAGTDETLTSNDAEVKFRQPANTMLSAYHGFNNGWAVMGSVTYTQWDVFNNLNLQNVMAVDSSGNPILTDVNIPQNFHNTWRVSLGTDYRVNEDWLLRAGVGYDQSPTNDTDRNLRLPDGNRYATSLGAHYQVTKMVGLDGGWTHEFIQNASINNTENENPQYTTVNGTSKSSADIVGLQITWKFV